MRTLSGRRSSVIGGRLATQVYEDLKQRLLSGEYAAGAPLVVTKICDEYGVSKQPVMEALRALAADRVVQIQPQVGVRVRQFNEHEVQAFFWMFSRCEGAMAHRAALLRTEAELERLAELCEELERLEIVSDEQGSRQYLQDNREIHALIHAMARSALAADISRDLWDLSDFLIATHGGGVAGRLAERNHQHREVLDALRRQDAIAAEEAMTAHVLSSPLSGQAPPVVRSAG